MKAKWSFFIGAAILVVGLLLKVGAPAEAILGGVILAALVTWRAGRLVPAAHRASK